MEPSAKSQARLREQVRLKLNHSTEWRPTPQVVAELNRLLRGWQGYYHYANSSRSFSKLGSFVNTRLARWHWRKHGCSRSLWSAHDPTKLAARYGLHQFSQRSKWRTHRQASGEQARKAGCGKTARPV